MELSNEFRVALPVDRAWAVLTDVERMAPCIPGAQLQEVEGDEYRGSLKVKVGPVTAQYAGQASFVSLDPQHHIAVLRADGDETPGQGKATAILTATLTADDNGTAVTVVTDLTVTGRVAQFGRGVLADVSSKLLDQFADNLERTVLADDRSGSPGDGAESLVAAVDESAPGGEWSTDDAGWSSAAEERSATEDELAPPGAEPSSARIAPSVAEEQSTAGAESEAPPVEAVDVELDDPMVAVQPDPGEPPAPVADPSPEADSAPKPAPDAPIVSPERPPLRPLDSEDPQPADQPTGGGSLLRRRGGPVLAVVAVVWVLKKLLSRSRD